MKEAAGNAEERARVQSMPCARATRLLCALARVSLRVSRPRSGSPSLLSSLTSRAPPGDTAWTAMDTHAGGHPLGVLRPPVCQTSKTPVSFPNKLPGAPLSTTSSSSSPSSSSQPVLSERSDVHKSCKTLETLLNLLNDYCEAAGAVVMLQKKLAKALKETAGQKATGELASACITYQALP